MATSRKNPNIKNANIEQEEFTPFQVQEFQKCSKDPIYFIKTYIKIQHPVRGAISFKLYPYQERTIALFHYHRLTITLSARQTGKSSMATAYLLWFAIFNFDKTILIASNKNDNAMEMIYRMQYAYEELPFWLKPGVVDGGWNKHGIEFDNKSRVLSSATSENTGRTFAISLLFLDEFAFVKPHIQEDFWTSINPTLATGGSCIIASTPNGDTNLFAQIWRSAEVGIEAEGSFPFFPIRIKWDEPPGRDEAFRKAETAKLGEQKFRQEYLCEFISSDALLIDSSLISHLESRIQKPTHNKNNIVFWDKIKKGQTYIIAIDPATGSGRDFTVIELFHFPSLVQIGEFRQNTMDSNRVYSVLKWLFRECAASQAEVFFSIENNGVGEGVIALFNNDDEDVDNVFFISESGKTRQGMVTGPKTKMKSCVEFKNLLEKNQFKLNSSVLIKEIKTYIRKGAGYEAQRGSTDDCVSACLIATRIINEMTSYNQDAFDKLYSYDTDGYLDDDSYDDTYEPDPIIF